MDKYEREICNVTGKICYSQKEAGTQINSAKNTWLRRGRKNKTPKRKYYCKHCGSFHLTSMKYFKIKER